MILFLPEIFESCSPVFCFSLLFLSPFKMWFLVDASGEKVSEVFPSQAKLAVHMQMTPQTLQRAIKKGKNVFQFRGQEARVVQQTIPQFAVFDFPPSERSGNPIETFELVSEVAKWLKVPNQTVYAAVKRGNETKVKKEGTVFWLKKLGAESGAKNAAVECSTPAISLPSLPLPPAATVSRPVPLPQSPSEPSPVVTSSTPSPPSEVAEVIRAGKTFLFLKLQNRLKQPLFFLQKRLQDSSSLDVEKCFCRGQKSTKCSSAMAKRFFSLIWCEKLSFFTSGIKCGKMRMEQQGRLLWKK